MLTPCLLPPVYVSPGWEIDQVEFGLLFWHQERLEEPVSAAEGRLRGSNSGGVSPQLGSNHLRQLPTEQGLISLNLVLCVSFESDPTSKLIIQHIHIELYNFFCLYHIN